MTLREKRVLFTRCVALLIQHAADLGYEVALDQVKRTKTEAAANAAAGTGIANSLHILGLAVDILLYRDLDGDGDQDYITDTAEYAELGKFWKSLHSLARWGGDFSRPDGGHFSIAHNGVS